MGKKDLEDLQDPGAPREGQAFAAVPERVYPRFRLHAEDTLQCMNSCLRQLL